MSLTHPIEEFSLPADIHSLRVIKNLQHFHDLIKRQSLPVRKDTTFESTAMTNADGTQTLNIQCKQCEAFFQYVTSKRGDTFTLNDYNQRHKHIQRQLCSINQSIIDRIQRFLNKEDRGQKHQLKADICTNYRISDRDFDQLFSQTAQRLKRTTLLYDGKQIDELAKKLKSERYTILGDFISTKVDREIRKITKSLIIINDQMSQYSKKYGQCCYISLDDRHQFYKWYIGAFLGVGRTIDIVPFGLFILKTVDTEHIKGLLKAYFGNSTISQKPMTIVTKQASFFDEAIQQLKNQRILSCEHLIDYATFTQRFQIKNPVFRKIIGDLARQTEKRKFFNKLQDIYTGSHFIDLQFDVEETANLANRMCLSQIPPIPVGPYRVIRNQVTSKRMDFSIIKQFNKMLVENEAHQIKNLDDKIKSILGKLLTPSSEQKHDLTYLMNVLPFLKDVRIHVTKNAMQQLINKSYQILHFRVIKISDDRYRVHDGKQFYYDVVFKELKRFINMSQKKWICDCQESLKTQLPCSHQLAVCMKTGFPLNEQLGERWTNQDEKRINPRIARVKKPRNKKMTISQFLA